MKPLRIDVAIPVLNEARYIRGCLDSVLAFERPAGLQWNMYVVDGGSTDETKVIAKEYAERYPEVHVLDNPGKIQSCALNLALKRATGDYFLRLDAHARYSPDYLLRCVESALASDAENTGGVVKTLPGADTYAAKVVQAVTTHRFGVGNAEFRLLPEPGPADTVPYGFFKRSVFEKVGLFDERLVRNQDYEVNRRILASGGRIWLDPRIIVHYFNQPTLSAFLQKQFLKEGPYNAYLWYLAPYARAFRHGITGAFALGVVAGATLSPFAAWITWPYCLVMALYFLLGFVAGVQQAFRYNEWRHAIAFPSALFLFHFSHGLGFLSGLLRLALGIAPVQETPEPWPGAGRFRASPIDSAPQNGRSSNIVTKRSIYQTFGKRWMDLFFALSGIVAAAVPIMGIAAWVRMTEGRPVFFRQSRVGKAGRCFRICKFRTMQNRAARDSSVTVAGDRRVTTTGRWLRRFKLDELPQLFNVLTGEMSFVGPRPDVPGYADRLQGEAAQILQLRPGITGPATLAFRNEEELLAQAEDPQRFNDEVIFPEKVRLNLDYLKNMSLVGDIGCILRTILPVQPAKRAILRPKQSMPASAV
jgi:lipopolysaccharide/colanic/teichoic acid biosynthesis glycosyltransferase/glycosyltransferase involved in cell wall biosynthesis